MMLAILLGLAVQAAPSSPVPAADPNHELNVSLKFDPASFAASDIDKDGVLSLAEFERSIDERIDVAIAANPAAQAKIKDYDRAQLRKAFAASFRSFDLNSDGVVTWPEMASFMGLKHTPAISPPK